ncbi:MAG: erythromycin esterase family protein [Bacteroidota bacterium]|nr:erythromycin esterase family protein [Bacteroidota bacterium]
MNDLKQCFKYLFLVAIIFIGLSSCHKENLPRVIRTDEENCWDIHSWQGLEHDSVLYINEIPEIPAVDQHYTNWLNNKENHIQIRSLMSTNFEDLKCLDDYIEGKKIVQLGESGHGPKEYNLMKVRLIKYLHEVHGFNVIAFESGFFETYHVNAHFMELSSYDALKKGIIHSVWHTEEVLDLLHYMKYFTGHKLQLAGFDCQGGMINTKMAYERALFLNNLVHKMDASYAAHVFTTEMVICRDYLNCDSLLTNIDEWKAEYTNLIAFIESNMDTLNAIFSDVPLYPQIALQFAKSNLANLDNHYGYCLGNYKYNPRDSAMAANIRFLKEVMFPDEKIIVWAHNAHIAYNLDNYSTAEWNGERMMGNWLLDYFDRKDLYTIGLYALRGWLYADDSLRIPESSNSLEAICYSTHKKNLFFDIENHLPETGNEWMDQKIRASHWSEYDKINLRKEYDAIIFLESLTKPFYID